MTTNKDLQMALKVVQKLENRHVTILVDITEFLKNKIVNKNLKVKSDHNLSEAIFINRKYNNNNVKKKTLVEMKYTIQQ